MTELNKTKFVECFFDTEVDHEKTLCRDNICIDQKEEQNGILKLKNLLFLIKLYD